MEIAIIIAGVLLTMLVLAGATALTLGVRRALVTHRARRALQMGEGTATASDVLWQARELTESPHVRAIASGQVTSAESAVLVVQETLETLPPGHHAEAVEQRRLLDEARTVRRSVVDADRHARDDDPRELAPAVSQALVAGLSAGELPASPAIRAAITSVRATPPARPPQAGALEFVDQAMTQLQQWLGGSPARPAAPARPGTPAGGTLGAGLASMALGLADTVSSWFPAPRSAGPAARRLVDSMEQVGDQVTPAYLWQLTERSEDALTHTTGSLTRFETELRPRNRRERWRRTWWPSVGDIVAQDALARGRQALVNEHSAHRALVEAVTALEGAEARVRGTAWALVQRDVRPGTFVGPDLRLATPALEAYLAEAQRR